MHPPPHRVLPSILTLIVSALFVFSQDAKKETEEPARGSIVEDRAARKLIEAGELRLAAGEDAKALEIWESCLERYPKSRVRFEAHQKLGAYLLEKKRAFDQARSHFEASAAEDNPDEAQRANALLKTGVCFYEARNYGASFQRLRDVIDKFPAAEAVNDAYFYIGLGHFKLGHYSRAIESLEKVGAGFSKQDATREKVEAGRRLYLKIDDADLAILEPGETVSVTVTSASGDEESVECLPLGRHTRVVIGSLPTALGQPQKMNHRLEVKGGDSVTVKYTDEHTADQKMKRPREHQIKVVGDAIVSVRDGSFAEPVQGVVIGKAAHLLVMDADGDASDKADSIQARVEILRAKTPAELEAESAAAQSSAAAGAEKPKVEPLKSISSREVTLTEFGPADGPVHSGLFRGSFASSGDSAGALGAQPGDLLRLSYQDHVNTGPEARLVQVEVRCVQGNLGEVTVARTRISDAELRVRTQLKTADALTHVGRFYKEFGLDDKATVKFGEALAVCEEAAGEAQKFGGAVLEESYVQLWRVQFAMEKLDQALAICERLQREFPGSSFVDEAMLQQALVARKKKDAARAIALFSGLVRLPKSPLRGEAQYGIGECYEELAAAAAAEQSAELFERAFQAYQEVYEKFPDHPRVGDAVAKMANFYYQNKDYARAIEVFETVLKDHPDANFLDVILFNFGRCLYRLEKKAEARKQFDQLIQEYPESPLAEESRKISQTLVKAGY